MSIIKAVPKALLQGIRDEGRGTLVPEPELLPTHLPWCPILAGRGPTTPQIAVGSDFTKLYGSEALDERSIYFTHQSAMGKKIVGNGNMVMWQRVNPGNGSATAYLRLAVEIIPTELDQYQRETSGQFKRGVNGDKLVANAGAISGYRVVWHRNPTSAISSTLAALGYAAPTDGTSYQGRIGTTAGANLAQLSTVATGYSKVYPIMDIPVSHFGAYGDRVGLRLTAPTSISNDPGDVIAMKIRKAFIYRLSCLERPALSSTPNVEQTVGGDLSIDAALQRDLVHPTTNLPISIEDNFIQAYQDLDTPGQAPVYGPFGGIKLYKTNLDTVLHALTQGAAAAAPFSATDGEKDFDASAVAYGRTSDLAFGAVGEVNNQLLNIFTGVDINGVPYDTFTVEDSVNFGGTYFADSVTHYASGGNDGLVITPTLGQDARLENLRRYDVEVANQFSNFGDLEAHLLDSAKYPFSAIWDSGFSYNTKLAMMVPMGLRKDIYINLVPWTAADYSDVSDPQPEEWVWGKELFPSTNGRLDIATEISQASVLQAAARLYPESVINGTATCRAAIWGHVGRMAGSTYRGDLPLSFDMADKMSKYQGSGDGVWVNAFSFDEAPLNQVGGFRDVSNTWKRDSAYNNSWDAGLNWVQSYDRSSNFWPAFKTVYNDDTSPLNGYITMTACVEAEKVCERVWRDLTGGSKLSPAQFITKSNKLINDKMSAGRFDSRFTITAETYFTQADEARGYSWTARINIYANGMRTVGSFTVVVRRASSLGQG